jgi:glycosyltransferase involved in cell wall biosynthesis
MKLRIEPSVAVITPTIANSALVKAIDSVKKQTHKNLHHLVVVDGIEYFDQVMRLPIPTPDASSLTITSAPFNTGHGGWNGQRIYAAYPHLLDHDYILFLDEDNWWDENHVSSLVDICEARKLDFSYSLRKVYEKGIYLADDCCEAIGRWPIAWFPEDQKQYLIDTSAYCFKRDYLLKVSNLWHNGIWGEDRRFFMAIKNNAGYETTGLHTLNYNLPDMDKAYGGHRDIFTKFNEVVKKTYNGEFPWVKQ